MAGPNARLTADLALVRGDRVADLACGTGVYTLEMARLADPGEVVAVDYSEGMLAAARERLEDEGYPVSLVHARAEDFIARTPAASFDVVSMRFVLAYIDWLEVLPLMGRMLRPGGRVGVLTSVNSSMPQLYTLFDRYPQLGRAGLEALQALRQGHRRDLAVLPPPARDLRARALHLRPRPRRAGGGSSGRGRARHHRRLDGDGAPVVRVGAGRGRLGPRLRLRVPSARST